MATNFYQELDQQNDSRHKKSGNKILFLQILRLSFFIIGITCFILFLSNSRVYFFPSCISFTSFIILITFYRKIENEKRNLKNINHVVKRELNFITCDFQSTKPVKQKIEETHPFAFDLDVLGENSLFSRLNRTTSAISEKLLIDSISNLNYNKKEIVKRQNAIDELSKRHALNVKFNAFGLQYFENESQVELLAQTFKTAKNSKNHFFLFFALLLSLCTIGALVLAINQTLPHQYWMILFAINLIISYRTKQKYVNSILFQEKSISILRKYNDISSLLSAYQFKDDYLISLASDSIKNLQVLSRILLILKIYKSSNFITNGLFLFDIYVIDQIEKAKLAKSINFKQQIINICQIEELISFAFFKFNNPSYIFPTLENKPGILNFKNMGHPFLDYKNCVKNDFEENGKNIILTGSNMSGKSTFLRSIGINYVLALTGSPVFATQFEVSIGKLYTSIKTTDSLADQKSFFFSEILRLSQIQKSINGETWALVLLDEVLKGTNSEDKLTGSVSLASRFSKMNCTLFFATHDTQMGILETLDTNAFKNYCFESIISKNEALYDYKLKRGVATSKNATFLMKKYGVID